MVPLNLHYSYTLFLLSVFLISCFDFFVKIFTFTLPEKEIKKFVYRSINSADHIKSCFIIEVRGQFVNSIHYNYTGTPPPIRALALNRLLWSETLMALPFVEN